jgi:hypothetical protein
MIVVFDNEKREIICAEGRHEGKPLQPREVQGRMLLGISWNDYGQLVLELE